MPLDRQAPCIRCGLPAVGGEHIHVDECRDRLRSRIVEEVYSLTAKLAVLMLDEHKLHNCPLPGEHRVHVCDCGTVWTSAPQVHGVLDGLMREFGAAVDREWGDALKPAADTPQPLTAALANGPVALVDAALTALSKLRVWAVMTAMDTPVAYQTRPTCVPGPRDHRIGHGDLADDGELHTPRGPVNGDQAVALIRTRRLHLGATVGRYCHNCGHAPARPEDLEVRLTSTAVGVDVCADPTACHNRHARNLEAVPL